MTLQQGPHLLQSHLPQRRKEAGLLRSLHPQQQRRQRCGGSAKGKQLRQRSASKRGAAPKLPRNLLVAAANPASRLVAMSLRYTFAGTNVCICIVLVAVLGMHALYIFDVLVSKPTLM